MGSGRGGGRWSAAESGHQLVGCAVCKIDCNSMEILEQHRKGKRHQKNVEKLEQERRRVAAMSSQEMLNSLPERRAELLSIANVTPPLKENDSGIDQFTGVLQSGVGSSEMVQIQQQIAAPKPVSRDRTPLKRPRPGGIDLRRMGPSPMKRPPKGRSLYDPRRGKRPKMSNAPSVASGPPPPKVCTICNITCDTQAVLECHLAGKKHAAKLKRFETQEQTFGPEALKELYISQSQKAIGLAEKRAPLTKEEQAGLLDILLGPSPHGPYGQEGEPSVQSAGERNLESASQQAVVGVLLLENEGGDQLDVGKSMEVEEDTMPAPEYGALPGECAVPGLE